MYDVEYRAEDLEIDLSSTILAKYKNFKYPESNPYLPRSFALDNPGKISKLKFKSKKTYHSYFQQDVLTNTPKAHLVVEMHSKLKSSVKNHMLQYLFYRLKKYELSNWSYGVLEAGYQFGLSGGRHLSVHVSGYSENIFKVFQDVFRPEVVGSKFQEIKITEQEFENIKNSTLKSFKDYKLRAPSGFLTLLDNEVRRNPSSSIPSRIKVLESLTLKDVKDFSKEFFKETFFVYLGYGNLSEEKFDNVVSQITENISVKSMDRDLIVKRKSNEFRLLPKNTENFKLFSGENNNNGILVFTKFSDYSLSSKIITDIIADAMSPKYFANLRSQQQLGYVVNFRSQSWAGDVGFHELIQSQSYGVEDLLARSRKFVDSYLMNVEKHITEEDFNTFKSVKKRELELQPNSLSGRYARFMRSVSLDDREQRALPSVLEALDKLSYSQFVESVKLFNKSKKTRISYIYSGKNKASGFGALKETLADESYLNWKTANPVFEKFRTQ